MENIDQLKSGLIDKILSINDENLLEALHRILSINQSEEKTIQLTSEQEQMLAMSQKDILKGRLISQEEMNKRNMEWLNDK